MRLTANQLITLLNIYRGSWDRERDCGTYAADLALLHRADLITRGFIAGSGGVGPVVTCPTEGDIWITTAKGDDLIRRLLGRP